jgi:hypothetical protein
VAARAYSVVVGVEADKRNLIDWPEWMGLRNVHTELAALASGALASSPPNGIEPFVWQK